MDRHGKKLDFWMKKRGKVIVEKPNEIPYVNLSEREFDSHQTKAFYIYKENIDLRETILRVETAIEMVPGEFRQLVRTNYLEEIRQKMHEMNRDGEEFWSR